MKTAKEVQNGFTKKFEALLKEYEADFECVCEHLGYPECKVTIMPKYDNTGNQISDFVEINLCGYRRSE